MNLKSYFFALWLCCIHALYAGPQITIITSVFKADKFIEFYLEDISQQSIYKKCEHIIINANSPGKEDTIIQNFASKHPNVRYVKLPFDPGLYGVWNIGILLSKGNYLINSNVDDHLKVDALEIFSTYLDTHPEVDLVYSDFYEVNIPNQSFENSTYLPLIHKPDFTLDALKTNCCPGPFPMWRKTLHAKYGLFDQSFKIKGDYEMWLRAGVNGAQFNRIPEPFGAFYSGPTNLSNNTMHDGQRRNEGKLLLRRYGARG